MYCKDNCSPGQNGQINELIANNQCVSQKANAVNIKNSILEIETLNKRKWLIINEKYQCYGFFRNLRGVFYWFERRSMRSEVMELDVKHEFSTARARELGLAARALARFSLLSRARG
jgi:hypothetical protein